MFLTLGWTPLPPCLHAGFKCFSHNQRAPLAVLLGALFLLTFSARAEAQLQSGRDVAGSLWLSDQGLPTGVQPAPLELDQVMSLTPEIQASGTAGRSALPPDRSPVTHQRMTAEESATCRSIDKRYEETRVNLANIERDKASGKLLIPDSGLITIRQNLASLERLKELCPKTPQHPL